MNEIKLPSKLEGRSRAKILTEEAFRETRNYIKLKDNRNFTQDVFAQLAKKHSKKAYSERNLREVKSKTAELREILNKISIENFDNLLNKLLKLEYNEDLMNNLKEIVYTKAVTEKKYTDLYSKICIEMFKIYNKKNYINNSDLNFQSLILKRCKEEFYNQNETMLVFSYIDDIEEIKERIADSKLSNIRLICDFYLNDIIPLKVINECFDFLILKQSDFNIKGICEILKKIYKKILIEDSKRFNKIMEYLQDL